MNKEQKSLLELIKIGLSEQCLCSDTMLHADWDVLYKLICQHGVSCLCMHALEVMYEYQLNFASTEINLKLYALTNAVKQHSLKKQKICASFAELIHPIKIVTLKGVDYARYWPKYEWREFGDLDCAVVEGTCDDLDKLAVEKNCSFDDGDMRHTIITWNGFNIENHHYFTSFAGAKESVLLEKELKRLLKGDFTKIADTELLSPNVNFTAVYMIAHAQKHFFYEGMFLRQILDWHFFLTKEGGNVDWKQVEDVLERTKLKSFAVLLTQICKTYFGLSFNPFDTDSDCKDELVEKFLDDIFSENKYSDHDRRWWMMIARMWNRFTRMFRFRVLLNLPVHKAIWKTIAYSSFFHRKPTLE